MSMSKDVARKLGDLIPFEYYPFASYIKGRTNGGDYGGDFKRHKTLAQARSAITSFHGTWGSGVVDTETHLYVWNGLVTDGHWERIEE